MKFVKEGRAKYISHLDLMHTIQRAMARCNMPLWFTEGFNQHAYISVALPLATGYSGEWELLDFNLLTEDVPQGAVDALNAVFSEGLRALEIYPLSDGGMKVGEIAWSKYQIRWGFTDGVPERFIPDVEALFQREDIQMVKRSKRGEQEVNLREWIDEQPSFRKEGDQVLAEVTTAAGSRNLNPEYLTRAVEQYLPQYTFSEEGYHRLCVYNAEMKPFR